MTELRNVSAIAVVAPDHALIRNGRKLQGGSGAETTIAGEEITG